MYRDYYNGPEVLQKADFVDEQNSESLTRFLRNVRSIANTDTCENVAGGLRVRFAEPTQHPQGVPSKTQPQCVDWQQASCAVLYHAICRSWCIRCVHCSLQLFDCGWSCHLLKA